MRGAAPFFLVFLSFFIVYRAQDTDPTIGGTLKLVVETFRHGARQRIYNTAYKYNDTRNFGELTAQGQRMHYILGQTLRKKYADSDIAFPKKYDHNFIQILSTDFNRTIMSAISQLYGMFPLGSGQDLSGIDKQFLVPPFTALNLENLDSYSLPAGQQTMAVYTRNRNEETQLLGHTSMTCDNVVTWQQENIQSDDWKRIQGQFQPLIDQLIAIPELGLPIGSNMSIVAQLIDTLTTIKWQNNDTETTKLASLIEGFTLSLEDMADPKNKEVLWVKMNLLYTMELHLLKFRTNQQKRTLISPYLKELLAYFNNAISNPNYVKWIMLSAHDTTIADISQAMNITSWQCIEQYNLGTLPSGSTCIYTYPGYASNIIFELYEDKNSLPFIKMMYNGTAQPLCGTSKTYCYLNKFTEQINDQLVKDFEAECRKLTSSSFSNWASSAVATVIIICLGAVIYIARLLKQIAVQAQKEYEEFNSEI